MEVPKGVPSLSLLSHTASRVITEVCLAQMGNRPLGNSCIAIETKSQTLLRREKNIVNLP